jgi:hypothetical protein
MTAAVNPGDYSEQTSRKNSNLRTRDYLEAIRFWGTHQDRRIQGVILCENSGADLRVFETAAAGFSRMRAFEVLGFRGNTRRPPEMHYGYSELGIIDYACRNSMLLKKYRHFIKVTGRLLFPRITPLIDSLDDDLLVAVDCRRAYRREGGVRLRARTQLMVFERDFYDRVLWGTRDEMIGNCSHIEEFLAQKLLPLYQNQTRGIYLRWKVECPAVGYGGAYDRKYASIGERLKNTIRSTCRRMIPMVWL